MSQITAYIALGSNLGDRLEHLRAAVRALRERAGIEVTGQSRVYETAPVGGPEGQGPFLNAAVRLITELPARELLRFLLETERTRGRERVEQWGPRTLDLDLLLYGSEIIREPGLTVPHPGLQNRAFVLEPLADLAPDMEIPGLSLTVRESRLKVDRAGVWVTDLKL
ncbi:MAG TPA: 2-amino-4-hydroxy-6-hydroxymethyldihydropteridine diphosphokinase [Blastocatellia bacterium]|nr:2-amino-4-hydroxy-6-hydroxymethyldihydropteridine diphosphokinase [Blastocatellia bacterium]